MKLAIEMIEGIDWDSVMNYGYMYCYSFKDGMLNNLVDTNIKTTIIYQ